jgi:hypothetical protein
VIDELDKIDPPAAAQPQDDPEALARLLRLVDGSLLPTVRAGRVALAGSDQAGDEHVRTALNHLREVESDLVCLLASRGVLT